VWVGPFHAERRVDGVKMDPTPSLEKQGVKLTELRAGRRKRTVALADSDDRDDAVKNFYDESEATRLSVLEALDFFELIVNELQALYNDVRQTPEGPCYPIATLEIIKEMRKTAFDKWDSATPLIKQWIRITLFIDLDTSASRLVWLP